MKGLDIGSDRVDELAATSAILLYSRGDRSAVYGTVHPVTEGKGGRATIGAGRPIERKALFDCLRELAENAAPKAEFLPETVLSVSQHSVMWWCRPAMRRVFFECEEIGRRSAVVPHPGLVFRAASHGFSVFALLEDGRPYACFCAIRTAVLQHVGRRKDLHRLGARSKASRCGIDRGLGERILRVCLHSPESRRQACFPQERRVRFLERNARRKLWRAVSERCARPHEIDAC